MRAHALGVERGDEVRIRVVHAAATGRVPATQPVVDDQRIDGGRHFTFTVMPQIGSSMRSGTDVFTTTSIRTIHGSPASGVLLRARISAVPRPTLPRELTHRILRRGGRPEEWFLGPLQARILQALAEQGESSVRDVFDALSRRTPLAYTTVMTVLDHLHRKAIVTRRLEGKGYRYTARFTSDELRDRMARHLVKELVDDFGETALVHFASALDRVDRRRLARLRRSR